MDNLKKTRANLSYKISYYDLLFNIVSRLINQHDFQIRKTCTPEV